MIKKIFDLVKKYEELVTYLIVGVLTTIVSWGAAWVAGLFLDSSITMQNNIINTISWVAGVLFAYPLSRVWVFKSKNPKILQEFLGFAGSRVSTWIMDIVIMMLTVNVLHMNYWIAKIFISAVIVTIANYIFSKVLIFKKKNDVLDYEKYEQALRLAGAEGSVLLKNDKETLPLKKDEKIAVYGRAQFDYIKSGSGSGGLVNIPYLVNVYDGLKKNGTVELDETVAERYRVWLKDHPYDRGVGWGGEPWSQVEMPLDEEEIRKDALRNEAALIVVGRLAGEDKDNSESEGSYLLRADERDMIKKVSENYKKTVVILNSGNVIDMKWVKEFNPSAVIYVWQGGCEGGNSIADVLTGITPPSGRLVDTIVESASDYPGLTDFGNKERLVYNDDIFVGYRYFETFERDKVLYPFGFGLSYTEFEHKASLNQSEDEIVVNVTVSNIGKVASKEVAQVYVKAPYGKLSKPTRELKGFAKTGLIKAGGREKLSISFPIASMASFDDTGATGHLNCFVLEAGNYEIYEGKNVRDARFIGKINVPELIVTEEVSEAYGPMESFERLAVGPNGEKTSETVPVRVSGAEERRKAALKDLKELPYKKNDYKLIDVYNKKITLDEFIEGLTDDELIYLTQGEGMCSVKATPGTAGAYVGSTEGLIKDKGIPTLCCSDGPSGIRMDTGAMALQTPNGVSLACTFNTDLVEEVFSYVGMELKANNIDTLLGPGINIHRHPLNGRNFEYFSEDPYMAGKMTVAELKGMHKFNVTGTIKHFCGNNQETGRFVVNDVMSKRALREIYLKAFEMAVKEAGAYSIMTSYNLVNGTHTASSYDLNQQILRKDWGFTGISMTDWWSPCNKEGEESLRDGLGYMIMAGGDVYMVNPDVVNSENTKQARALLASGELTRKELVRSAEEILTNTLKSNAMLRLAGKDLTVKTLNTPINDKEKIHALAATMEESLTINPEELDLSKGVKNVIHITTNAVGEYTLSMDAAAEGTELSQINFSIGVNNTVRGAVTKNGSEHEFKHEDVSIGMIRNTNFNLTLTASEDGLKLKNVMFTRK